MCGGIKDMAKIAENILAIKKKIAELLLTQSPPGSRGISRGGQSPLPPTGRKAELIAVSKGHSEAEVREALAAGQRIFGENRAQEAQGKFPQLQKEFPDLKLHLIGPLQSNKVKDALKIFDVIETIDREKLARELVKHDLTGKEFFIQVNIGEEPQKAGIPPQETEKFYKFCRDELKLNITGLMCIPPVGEPAFMYFALLKNLAMQLRNHTTTQLKLSMGMSTDYEEALEMGADYIRVGTGVFGERV